MGAQVKTFLEEAEDILKTDKQIPEAFKPVLERMIDEMRVQHVIARGTCVTKGLEVTVQFQRDALEWFVFKMGMRLNPQQTAPPVQTPLRSPVQGRS